MYCDNCGIQLNDGSTFCGNCGTKQEARDIAPPPPHSLDLQQNSDQPPQGFAQPPQKPNQTPQEFIQQPMKASQPQDGLNQTDKSKPMSIWQYLLTIIILAVPILNIVMLFVWAFGSKANFNKKNLARATLILVVVSVALWIAVGSSIYGSLIKNMGDFNIGSITSSFNSKKDIVNFDNSIAAQDPEKAAEVQVTVNNTAVQQEQSSNKTSQDPEKSNVDVETVGFTLSVAEKTSEPGKIETAFSQDVTRIYYVAKIKNLPANTEMRDSWYFEDQLIDESMFSISFDIEDSYFDSYMDAGKWAGIDDNKWPEGEYKVVVTCTRDDKEVLKITDQFRIKK